MQAVTKKPFRRFKLLERHEAFFNNLLVLESEVVSPVTMKG